MKIVVDVNVILSSLLTSGNSSEVFKINSIFNKFDFMAPEFLLAELGKHKEEFFKRSGLLRKEFDGVLEFVLKQMTFIPKSEFSEYIPNAEKMLSEHLKDVPYVALALKIGCPIFSGDKTLKRLLSNTSVEVLSPREMLDKLGKTI